MNLTLLTAQLLTILDKFKIVLLPTHLPGHRNVRADALSRLGHASPTEWRLGHEALDKLFSAWGQPTIDLFATKENKVLPIFCSPYPDESAWAVDALSIAWDDFQLAYAFPPQAIVPKVLQKIRESKGSTFILVASQSPSRPWLPILLELSVAQRLELNDVLILYQYLPGFNEPEFHPDPSTLSLAGWLLSSPL